MAKKVKISMPHGYFKRRFTHKRKKFLGFKTELFDRVTGQWVALSDYELDSSLKHYVAFMPSSSFERPSTLTTMSYVESGVLPDPISSREESSTASANVIDREAFMAEERAHMEQVAASREAEFRDVRISTPEPAVTASTSDWGDSFRSSSESSGYSSGSSDSSYSSGSSDSGSSSSFE